MIDQVRRQLDATKENYRTVLARSQQESAEMAKKASEVLGEIDRITATLGRSEADKSRGGLRDVPEQSASPKRRNESSWRIMI